MDEHILGLLRKYLDNRCTPAELDKVQDILQNGRNEEEWAAVLQQDARQMMEEPDSEELTKLKEEQLLNRILESTRQVTTSQSEQENKSVIFPIWFRIAASVLILLTGGLAFMIAFWLPANDMTGAVTAAGEQTEVLLEDGTRVWLNDQSTLHYPDIFDGETREVYLQGNAFFEVASNPSQPFLLHSNGAVIEVLGTSFHVRAYDDDRNITVVLATGRVSVTPETGRPEAPVSMLPGDQWIYDKVTGEYRLQKISDEDMMAIRNGLLMFHDQPLEDITRAMERRYQIRFRFENESLKQAQLTFKPGGSDLEEAMEILSLVAGFEYRLTENGDIFIK